MYKTTLTQAGLSSEQAHIYEFLLKNGASVVRDIAKNVPFSRPMVYKVLEELVQAALVEKQEKKGSVTTFVAAHPQHLIDQAEQTKDQAETALNALSASIDTLISDYNLQSGKPGVRFFEGIAGIRKVLADSLTAQEVIYSYADLESIDKYIGNINREYAETREKKDIRKKGIVLDTPVAREFLKNYEPGVTETRVISRDAAPFHTVMQIYDNKISYITLSDETIIGVIIDDKHIAGMHKYLFEYLWERATQPIDLA